MVAKFGAQELTITKLISKFLKDEDGATAIEYGLIAALVALAVITGATKLGTQIGATFNTVANSMKS